MRKKSFQDEVAKQLVNFNSDPMMLWAMKLAIPLFAGIMCVVMGVWLLTIDWKFLGVITLAFGCNFLYNAFVARYRWNVRMP